MLGGGCMKTIRILAAMALSLVMAFGLFACGGGGGGGDAASDGGTPSGGTGDFYKIAINDGTEVTYDEKSGLPAIDCDPRVDWFSNNVILYNNFSGGTYDTVFDILFIDDSVGTYDITVPADGVVGVYTTGGLAYQASFGYSNSSGMVEVTRSDTRIEGSFIINTVDGSNNPGPKLAGSFGVDSGVNLSCE